MPASGAEDRSSLELKISEAEVAAAITAACGQSDKTCLFGQIRHIRVRHMSVFEKTAASQSASWTRQRTKNIGFCGLLPWYVATYCLVCTQGFELEAWACFEKEEEGGSTVCVCVCLGIYI